METDNVGEELLRDLEGVVGGAAFDWVHYFGGAVGEGEGGVVALTGRQSDPVPADGLPAAAGKLDGLEYTSVVSMLGLGALANVATLDELVNGRGKAGEGVASLECMTPSRGRPSVRTTHPNGGCG